MAATAVFLIFGAYLGAQQAALSDSVLRLHVIANSDSDEDQALKLQVRDRVLAKAEELCANAGTAADAETALGANLGLLCREGQAAVDEAGYDYTVTATLEKTWFPTKEYADVALPAGTYNALRVVIGSGEGHNWWCVLFPSLTMGAAAADTSDLSSDSGLTKGQIGLMTGENGGYAVKFKCMELWDEMTRNVPGQ